MVWTLAEVHIKIYKKQLEIFLLRHINEYVIVN